MAMICDYCGKGIMYGNKVSHAKNRSKRTFKPNLHSKRVKVGTRTIKAKLCSGCLKILKRDTKLQEEAAKLQEATPDKASRSL